MEVKYVAIALTVYGIETITVDDGIVASSLVAIALTVYGIETKNKGLIRTDLITGCNSTYRLRY